MNDIAEENEQSRSEQVPYHTLLCQPRSERQSSEGISRWQNNARLMTWSKMVWRKGIGARVGCSPGKVLIRYKRLRERYYLIRSTWMPPPSSTDDDDGDEQEVGDDVATTTGENGDENETKWMNGRMDGRINGVVDGCFLFCSSFFYRSAFCAAFVGYTVVACPPRRHRRNDGRGVWMQR